MKNTCTECEGYSCEDGQNAIISTVDGETTFHPGTTIEQCRSGTIKDLHEISQPQSNIQIYDPDQPPMSLFEDLSTALMGSENVSNIQITEVACEIRASFQKYEVTFK